MNSENRQRWIGVELVGRDLRHIWWWCLEALNGEFDEGGKSLK